MYPQFVLLLRPPQSEKQHNLPPPPPQTSPQQLYKFLARAPWLGDAANLQVRKRISSGRLHILALLALVSSPNYCPSRRLSTFLFKGRGTSSALFPSTQITTRETGFAPWQRLCASKDEKKQEGSTDGGSWGRLSPLPLGRSRKCKYTETYIETQQKILGLSEVPPQWQCIISSRESSN